MWGKSFAVILGSTVVLAGAGAFPARALQTVSVGVGGRPQVTYLPVTLADQLGFFREEGIAIKFSDFTGGSKSVEALVGGSVDATTSAYEHVVFLQAKGVDLVTVALFDTSYGAVIGLKPKLAAAYHSPADLKGLKIGVTAPGSASAFALDVLLAKAGLTHSDIAVIGTGGGSTAVAAMKSGQLDGLSHFDPMISELVHDGDLVPIADTRTRDGMKALYGGDIAASGITMRADYVAGHRELVQHFVNAIVHALKWVQTASLDQIADTVPPFFYGKQRELYKETVGIFRSNFTPDGRTPRVAAEYTYQLLARFGSLPKGDVDLAKTYDNSFADAAAKRFH